MSTGREHEQPVSIAARREAVQLHRSVDPAERVALIARAKRELLLRAYHRELRREDLEDCFSQATFELLARARSGSVFASDVHLARVLEQRFLSRIRDRRRAQRGRSSIQTALAEAVRLGDIEDGDVDVIDTRAEVEELVLQRLRLRSLTARIRELTPDQRRVIAGQALLDMDCAALCRAYGWSPETQRKLAQRARARLRLGEESAA